ncbi:uncharacterized protein ARMOST_04167 [Armillaria ostoyae]|uniref:Uncharacterized protein n=1 Tax=Armillaria ostoyae TaxID=47428 RepID=A0A284QWM1_ARMOS|nr:uncharacterized protein ARMOST_04167 [Armillaria ostoyae]
MQRHRSSREYQFTRYGSVLFCPPEGLEIDDTPIPGKFAMVYCRVGGILLSGLTEELISYSSDSHKLDLASEESPQVPVPSQKEST